MNDSTLDMMIERAVMDLWEEQNAPNPHEEEYRKAAESMQEAMDLIERATDCALYAREQVDGIPVEYRIAALQSDLNSLWCDFKDLRDKLKEGTC